VLSLTLIVLSALLLVALLIPALTQALRWVGIWVTENLRWILPIMLVIVILIVVIPLLIKTPPSQKGSVFTATATHPSLVGVGVIRASDGEYIGVSDGTFAFDTNRPDGIIKREATAKLKAGDSEGAQSLWQQALQVESNDPELLIYQEDQRVVASGSPYITILVGTMLTGKYVGIGRDDLQGAYVAQKEYNDGFKLRGVLVRLLIASSGNNVTDAAQVARQIVQASQQDPTIVGVMGWPFSSRALQEVGVLNAAHIPMVSATASSDSLSGISPYFFRIAPSNNDEGVTGAKYAEQTLRAQKVVLFFDPHDAYSNSLAADFQKQFTAGGNTIIATEIYTVGKPQTLPALLQDAMKHNPDLIYFSGYADDASALLINLPTSGPFANLQVLGGDALYELQGYSPNARAGFNRLRFTAFAYPDEWDVLGLTAQKPVFFTEYVADFDSNGKFVGSPYGYTRATNDTILSYDATMVMLEASRSLLTQGKMSFTPDELRQSLASITSRHEIQGVSGQMTFGPKGDSFNKALIILYVDRNGYIHMEPGIVSGCFQVGHCR
jgi:eukaryotic-like serine/threonine-protein kinase